MAPIFTGLAKGLGGFAFSGGSAAPPGAVVYSDWTRIVNQAGAYPGDTPGSFPTTGYDELLIFGIAGGGGGGFGGDDDGGGGGGGGASQLEGYWIPKDNFVPGTYTYVIPGGGAPSNKPTQGGDSPNLTVSSPGGIVFSLNGGKGAESTTSNNTGNNAGAGGALNPYASHRGGNGNLHVGRVVDNTGGGGPSGVIAEGPGSFGGAGGGGAGVWAGSAPTSGQPGNTANAPTSSITEFEGTALNPTYSRTTVGGAPGANRTPDGGPPVGGAIQPAEGGPSGVYNGGGGAGSGSQFFGVGNYGYGGGGGGGAAQGGTQSGRGGAGYLIVYARSATQL